MALAFYCLCETGYSGLLNYRLLGHGLKDAKIGREFPPSRQWSFLFLGIMMNGSANCLSDLGPSLLLRRGSRTGAQTRRDSDTRLPPGTTNSWAYYDSDADEMYERVWLVEEA